jgi:hypothetical protein
MQSPRKILPLVFVGLGALIYFSLAAKWPTEQRLHLALGDRALRVVEVRVRCGGTTADGNRAKGDDWAAEVMFHYAKGQAPRIVSYEPRLANGEYLVEIEVTTDEGRVLTTDRRVRLLGGTTSIDLSTEPSAEGTH